MDREYALGLVADLKAELPVPSETCPAIDHAIFLIKRLGKHLGLHPLPSDLLTAIDMLEALRKDNDTLRELGREWHTLASDLAHQFEDTGIGGEKS